MAQQPAKLAWKQKVTFGLSASQFGMALGFCGKVSDFVDYQRNIVGTEQEFRGNTATAHGINTEAKSRALYEILTGIQVYDGGFFLADDRMLGCSPDGRSFYYDTPRPAPQHGQQALQDNLLARVSGGGTLLGKRSFSEADAAMIRSSSSNDIFGGSVASPPLTPASPALSNSSSTATSPNVRAPFSIKLPFKGKRTRGSDELNGTPRKSLSQPAPTIEAPPLSEPQPLTKYDASPAAGRYPNRRMRLLEIKSPFSALYDCRRDNNRPYGIPLQYMCQMQGQMALAGAIECDFFVYLDGPPFCHVEAWRVKYSPVFWEWARPKLLQVVGWVRDGPLESVTRAFSFEPFNFTTLDVAPLIFPFCITSQAPLDDIANFTFFQRFESPYYKTAGGNFDFHAPTPGATTKVPPGMMDDKAVAIIYSDVIKFLFDSAEEVYPGLTRGEIDRLPDKAIDTADGAERPPKSAIFRVARGKDPAFYEDFISTIVYKGKWNSLCGLIGEEDEHTNGEPMLNADTLCRSEVLLTVPADWEAAEVEVQFRIPSGSSGGPPHTKSVKARLYHREFFLLLKFLKLERTEECVVDEEDTADGTCPQPRCETEADSHGGHPVMLYVDVTPPANKVRRVEDGDRSPCDLSGSRSGTLLTPSARDNFESLSQQVRLSLSPQPQELEPDTATSAADLLVQHIGLADLLSLLQDGADCSKVVVLDRLDRPIRTFWRDSLAVEDSNRGATEASNAGEFTLVAGNGEVLDAIAIHALNPVQGGVAALPTGWHRSILSLTGWASEAVTQQQRTGGAPPQSRMVWCYVEEDGAPVGTAHRRVLTTPCFILHATDRPAVLARVVTEAQTWGL